LTAYQKLINMSVCKL